jgi:hypothetical protein
MRSSLKVSFICNLCLAGTLIFILTHRQPQEAASNHPSVIEAQPPLTPVPSKPFHWHQLESTNDYREYVNNLRGIGCPESTVEDIVWGDAERVFSSERRKLNLTGDEAGAWSKQRETQLVDHFLGKTPALADSPPPDNPTKAAGRKSAPAVYPLAFRDVNLDSLGLTAVQKEAIQQAIAGIRQQFIDQIGGLNQDPSDPAYLERWRKAQPQNDDALRGWLGGKTFMAYQLAAQANAAAQNN